MYVRPNLRVVGKNRYCSRECFGKASRKYPKDAICRNCSIAFRYGTANTGIYCSRGCWKEHKYARLYFHYERCGTEFWRSKFQAKKVLYVIVPETVFVYLMLEATHFFGRAEHHSNHIPQSSITVLRNRCANEMGVTVKCVDYPSVITEENSMSTTLITIKKILIQTILLLSVFAATARLSFMLEASC